MAEAPRVFFSYSHDSAEHKDRVLALCDRLRQDGLNAWIDQYEQSPPEGWPRWMDRQIEQAEFVLIVCTEVYLRRFRGLETPGRGLGANWEGAVITQELYEAALRNTKFIPVVVSPEDGEHLPIVLRGVTRYRADLEEGYEALLRHLTHQPASPPQDPGPLRELPPHPRPTLPLRTDGRRKLTVLTCLLLFLAMLVAVAVYRKVGPDPEEVAGAQEKAPSLQMLRGQVLDAQSREPLPGVEVRLPDYGLVRVTDQYGQYAFELAVAAGTRVNWRATKKGYEPLNQDPSVGSGPQDTFRMWRQP